MYEVKTEFLIKHSCKYVFKKKKPNALFFLLEIVTLVLQFWTVWHGNEVVRCDCLLPVHL